ncbi:MAG: hypothetical protein KAQ62_25740 [Cyclobacteriaceae bacterium]|nr:hypothetical protein [Cyclobacteriaceae bacterium]MCK5372000.1 hypothetical protein [Cyclobacteriaceae bacterium]
MTTAGFSELTPKSQMDHLKRTSTLIHRIIKGNMIVSLYWSKDFIYEVLNPKNNLKKYDIKCFDRFKYVHS